MSFIQSTLKYFGLTTKAQADTQINRSYEAGYYDGMNGNDEPPSGTLASYGYAQSNTGKRDFTSMSQDQLLNIAWVLYQSNPLAKRYLEIVRDHVLGRGVQVTTEDEDFRAIIDTFWKRNKMDANLKKFTPQLRLLGEQCYPAFVRQTDGRVTIGYVDPADIDHVVLHPHNVLRPVMVILKFDNSYRKRRIYRIIQEDEGFVRGNTVVLPRYDGKLVTWEQAQIEPWEQLALESNGISQYTGSCFYYSVNNVSNQPRGFSDFLQVADWLDADDETLFALADREQIAGYFSWDVTLDGIDKTEVTARAAEMRTRVPKKGQLNVHNDKEHWEMKSPDLKQQGSIATSEALSDRAWGMLGMPKIWRGIGEGTNYASGLVMGEPTRKSLENKQDTVKDMITEMIAFARDQAEIAGYYKGDGEFEVIMPEMSAADVAQIATALPQITNALSVLVNDLRVIGRQRAGEITAKLLNEIGIKYDAAEEIALIDEAEPEQGEQDTATADAANKYLMGLLQGNNGVPKNNGSEL